MPFAVYKLAHEMPNELVVRQRNGVILSAGIYFFSSSETTLKFVSLARSSRPGSSSSHSK